MTTAIAIMSGVVAVNVALYVALDPFGRRRKRRWQRMWDARDAAESGRGTPGHRVARATNFAPSGDADAACVNPLCAVPFRHAPHTTEMRPAVPPAESGRNTDDLGLTGEVDWENYVDETGYA